MSPETASISPKAPRRSLAIGGIVVCLLGLAFGLERPRPPLGRLCQAAFVLLAVGYNWVLMWLYLKNCLPHEGYLY